MFYPRGVAPTTNRMLGWGMDDTHLCGCGCGQRTRFIRGHWSKFLPGHDLRLLTALVKLIQTGDATLSEAHDLVREVYSPGLARRLLDLWERSEHAGRRTRPKAKTKASARR